MKPLWAITILCVVVYSLTTYGGIRAPDAEVVFRVSENLADGKGFGVSSDLENWRGFGVAIGKDSILYSVYPPGESVVMAPFIIAARWINQSGWYEDVNLPLSHYVKDGLRKTIYGQNEAEKTPHASRFVVSLFNILFTTLGVLVFYRILLLMTQSEVASLAVALLYAFGTIIWNYSGTFFSEPLTLFWILSSFYYLMKCDPDLCEVPSESKPIHFVLSGILLGLALVTHTNSVILVPFFFFYARYLSKSRFEMVFFLSGVCAFVLLLGYFNWFRFGSFMESGRGLSQYNPVDFVTPLSSQFWKNVFSLLLGYGKGLLWFCPAVLLGIFSWQYLKQRHRLMSRLFATMSLSVVLLVAAYSYWHAGFCLGPRYLLMIIPFLLVPLALWLKEAVTRNKRPSLLLVAVSASMAMIQQLYFCVGELFSFYHIQKWSYLNKGVDIFVNDRIYIDWRFSPVHQLLDYLRGPFVFRTMEISNYALWLLLSTVILILVGFTLFLFYPQKTKRPVQ